MSAPCRPPSRPAAIRCTGASRCSSNGNLNSIAYAQNPLDLQKGFATPGVEAKELFRPLNQLSGQAQVTDDVVDRSAVLARMGIVPLSRGRHLSRPGRLRVQRPAPPVRLAALGFAQRGNPVEPDQSGEWGLAARWSPQWLDGTLGFYYRNFADKLPQILLTQVGTEQQPLQPDLRRQHRSVRHQPREERRWRQRRRRSFLPPQHAAEQPGARHLARAAERRRDQRAARQHLARARQRARRDPAARRCSTPRLGLRAGVGAWTNVQQRREPVHARRALRLQRAVASDKWDGCTTKDYFGIGLGVHADLVPGVSRASTCRRRSPTRAASAATRRRSSAATRTTATTPSASAADIYQKYRFDLKYIDYFGHYQDNGTAVTAQNGFTTLLKDRGFVSLTFKTTF